MGKHRPPVPRNTQSGTGKSKHHRRSSTSSAASSDHSSHSSPSKGLPAAPPAPGRPKAARTHEDMDATGYQHRPSSPAATTPWQPWRTRNPLSRRTTAWVETEAQSSFRSTKSAFASWRRQPTILGPPSG
ncbi:uncharacterized protein LOC126980951 [Eriocheir sinensis]|uniref:uncharacterized protein LOC126980951 n=1 Tax=Eriocheir sinensis TaxID=95602 RepID=UPI0021C98A05|nr:uncharacterized protein LOC126980951 [Eriocheir sinensis]